MPFQLVVLPAEFGHQFNNFYFVSCSREMEIYCESADYSVHVDWSIKWRLLLSVTILFRVEIAAIVFGPSFF